MKYIVIIISGILLILIGLSIPPALLSKSWKRFFLSVFLSAAGILFPLIIFAMSMFLVPQWKGGCHYGWLDCFHVGKLVLTPLVVWACAAFYVIQIHRPEDGYKTWVVLGIFTGSIVSVVCLIFGLMVHAFHSVEQWWLLVPFYVAAWYTALCIFTFRKVRPSLRSLGITILSSLPLWILSLIASRAHYSSLPDHPPDCFIITAALRGHRMIVGSFAYIEKNGEVCIVNQQLMTFRQFERLWVFHCPRTHRRFRRFYNWLGPKIAAQIKSQLAADLVYVLLKPFEAVAAAVIWFHEWKESRTLSCTSRDRLVL